MSEKGKKTKGIRSALLIVWCTILMVAVIIAAAFAITLPLKHSNSGLEKTTSTPQKQQDVQVVIMPSETKENEQADNITMYTPPVTIQESTKSADFIEKETTKPASKPGATKPAAKPETTKPAAKPETTKPAAKPETTKPQTTDNYEAYRQAMDDENLRHEKKINDISAIYNGQISIQEEMARDFRSQGGYGSVYEYQRQYDELSETIIKKEKRLALYKMDSSGMYVREIRALEAELERDYARAESLYMSIFAIKEAEKYENEVANLTKSMQYEINAENEEHQNNIQQIKTKYGR